MRKASWNIRNRLKRRLALSLLFYASFCFFFGYYFHWGFFFLIILDLAITYFRNKKSREKYLIAFEERVDDIVLGFITTDFKTGEDVMAKDNLAFIEMSRAPFGQDSQWKLILNITPVAII